jgi:hypothetical protein
MDGDPTLMRPLPVAQGDIGSIVVEIGAQAHARRGARLRERGDPVSQCL